MALRNLSTLFLFASVFQVWTAVGFVFQSEGFLEEVGDQVFQCVELKSSGAESEVLMLLYAVLSVSVVWRLFRLNMTPSMAEGLTYFGGFLAASLVLSVFSDCGGYWTTLFATGDGFLVSFAAASTVSFFSMLVLFLGSNGLSSP